MIGWAIGRSDRVVDRTAGWDKRSVEPVVRLDQFRHLHFQECKWDNVGVYRFTSMCVCVIARVFLCKWQMPDLRVQHWHWQEVKKSTFDMYV